MQGKRENYHGFGRFLAYERNALAIGMAVNEKQVGTWSHLPFVLSDFNRY